MLLAYSPCTAEPTASAPIAACLHLTHTRMHERTTFTNADVHIHIHTHTHTHTHIFGELILLHAAVPLCAVASDNSLKKQQLVEATKAGLQRGEPSLWCCWSIQSACCVRDKLCPCEQHFQPSSVTSLGNERGRCLFQMSTQNESHT